MQNPRFSIGDRVYFYNAPECCPNSLVAGIVTKIVSIKEARRNPENMAEFISTDSVIYDLESDPAVRAGQSFYEIGETFIFGTEQEAINGGLVRQEGIVNALRSRVSG